MGTTNTIKRAMSFKPVEHRVVPTTAKSPLGYRTLAETDVVVLNKRLADIGPEISGAVGKLNQQTKVVMKNNGFTAAEIRVIQKEMNRTGQNVFGATNFLAAGVSSTNVYGGVVGAIQRAPTHIKNAHAKAKAAAAKHPRLTKILITAGALGGIAGIVKIVSAVLGRDDSSVVYNNFSFSDDPFAGEPVEDFDDLLDLYAAYAESGVTSEQYQVLKDTFDELGQSDIDDESLEFLAMSLAEMKSKGFGSNGAYRFSGTAPELNVVATGKYYTDGAHDLVALGLQANHRVNASVPLLGLAWVAPTSLTQEQQLKMSFMGFDLTDDIVGTLTNLDGQPLDYKTTVMMVRGIFDKLAKYVGDTAIIPKDADTWPAF